MSEDSKFEIQINQQIDLQKWMRDKHDHTLFDKIREIIEINEVEGYSQAIEAEEYGLSSQLTASKIQVHHPLKDHKPFEMDYNQELKMKLSDREELKITRLLSPNKTQVKILKHQWVFNYEGRYLLCLCKYPESDASLLNIYAYCLVLHSLKVQPLLPISDA